MSISSDLLWTLVARGATAAGLAVGLLHPSGARAQPDEPTGNESRLTLSTDHEIRGDLTGFGQFEYRNNPEDDYQAVQLLWPGLRYAVKNWLQLSGGWLTRYTDNEQSAATLELRPFAGVELSARTKLKWSFYNYTRYEFRDIEDLDTHTWTGYSRLRSRFGVSFPLASSRTAWQPKTWYGLADLEPIYRFDRDVVDPLNVRAGIGYILSDSIRMEFVYWAQFTRPNQALEHTDNIFQLNIKLGFGRGLLSRLYDQGNAGE